MDVRRLLSAVGADGGGTRLASVVTRALIDPSRALVASSAELETIIGDLVRRELFVEGLPPQDVESIAPSDAAELGYGEVLPPFIEWMIATFGLTRDDTFVDVGSGVGQVLVRVAALTGADAIGYELIPELAALGARNIDVVQRALAARSLTTGWATSVHGDATRPLFWPIIDDDDDDEVVVRRPPFVFIDNFLFPSRVTTTIVRALLADVDRMPPGTRLLLARELVWTRGDDEDLFRRLVMRFDDDDAQNPSLHETPPDAASWTDKPLTMTLYTVRAPSMEPEYEQRYRRLYIERVERARRRNIGERER